MDKKEIKKDEKNLYEVSFLILPNLNESDVSKEASSIGELIAKEGGVMKTSDGPSLKDLAYTMERNEGGKNYRYDTAHSGFFVFEGEPEVAKSIDEKLREFKSILRHMLIKTSHEAFVPRERRVLGKIEPEKFRDETPAQSETTPKMSEEELDKTIEELVVK